MTPRTNTHHYSFWMVKFEICRWDVERKTGELVVTMEIAELTTTVTSQTMMSYRIFQQSLGKVIFHSCFFNNLHCNEHHIKHT